MPPDAPTSELPLPRGRIGFRRTRSPWQQDLAALVEFAAESGFAFIDLGPADGSMVDLIRRAGLRVGTADLPDWPGLLSPDAGARRAAVVAAASYLRSLTAVGVTRFLSVLVPKDPARPRGENFAFATEAYIAFAHAAEECGASILIEGAPGRPPYFANLGCTPADLRQFLDAVGSRAIGINFDPSHLVRMGIDPVRFIREFGTRIGHVHAKDTLFSTEDIYQHGTLQEATFTKPHVYGAFSWRYALPGRGAVPWAAVLSALRDAAHGPADSNTVDVSIELEDADYLGEAAGEKKGLLEAKAFLDRLLDQATL